MNKAATAFAELKAQMATIDRTGEFAGLGELRAIADRFGMACLDQSEDVDGIDQTFRLTVGDFTAELVYQYMNAAQGDRDRVTLFLTLLRDDTIVDVVEIEEMSARATA